MPYIAQIGEENKNIALTRMVPTYSIQDHETAGPVNPNDYFAHGPTVWKVVQGHEEHCRSILNAKKLLSQIENKIYYNTNSTWNSREVIDTAPSLMFRVQSPYPAVTD